MYLSRLTLNRSRMAMLWCSNPYRIHQRLMIACGNDMRVLFRVEETSAGIQQIIVQSHDQPDWDTAFTDFPVLSGMIECKSIELKLEKGRSYRFRLLANPTVKKTIAQDGEAKKSRLGLISEEAQVKWLERKLAAAGSELLTVQVAPRGLQYSKKNSGKPNESQTHLAVLFEGILSTREPELLLQILKKGVGSAKGFGFGLLSLAPVN